MSKNILILIEATGIQEYIFGSNQLAQNIGASELVTQATTDWVVAKLEELHIKHNAIKNSKKEWEPNNQSIYADGLQAEIVYMGGGNAMLLFIDDGQAEEFARRLTRHALEQAPGLELVLMREPFDPRNDVLSNKHQGLREKLAKRKLNRTHSSPLLGLGITAACVYTGLPAIGMSDDDTVVGKAAAEKVRQTGEEPVSISMEVAAKLGAEDIGKDRLKRSLPQVEKAGYEFVYDFDDFGEKGESSYLAVIHADGNNMGERIKAIGKQHNQAGKEGSENYARALRAFSKSVGEAAEKALSATVNMLLDSKNLEKDDKGVKRYGGIVPLREPHGKPLLPFRPIVFGGDDVTFVSEGRLGLTLAVKYLATYTSQPLEDARKLAYARAGVAVVKSHYPFSRAYELADDLIKSAKAYIREKEEHGEMNALDWHFAVGGLVLPLKQVREREYKCPAGSLLMRPVRLGASDGDWRSWQTFTEVIIKEFQMEEKDKGQWAGRRNKIKAFRDALRAGTEAVHQFLHLYRLDGLELPDIPGAPEMKHQGWQGGRCGYFDAIEALDFYVPLKGE